MEPSAFTLQQVLTGILIPAVTAGFWLLWSRIIETRDAQNTVAGSLWDAITTERARLTSFQVECERRFARVEELERLEGRIEARFDRLEEKLDRAIGRREEA